MREYGTKAAEVNFQVDLAPWFLRRAVAWYYINRHRFPDRATKLLSPVFDERRRMQQECGEERWRTEKPDDAIQWIMDGAAKLSKEQQTNKQLTWRLLWLNFAAIETTSMSTTHALYDIVSHPEYIAPLREEIIACLDAYGGYTKEALTNMVKLDSCLRETQRFNTVVSIVMSRVTKRDYTFKSGREPLTLPKGTFVTVPAAAMHLSTRIYGPDALEWKGFRFSEMREQEDNKEGSAKYQATATSSTYLGFSHGRHACTGRFFAVYQLKMLLSYLLLRYDMRWPMDVDGKRPENVLVTGRRSADLNAELEFREREEWKDLKYRWGDLEGEKA
ncbi:hypothetical protein TWF696_008915 [Orbilia brochopaga]|uniref:Cytochrome P450 n=1 Tax=Orbilia brochopaga TaxID=3140254 RepID=A0AAV9UHB1_9PEZI